MIPKEDNNNQRIINNPIRKNYYTEINKLLTESLEMET
jgi:hypothetical protein